MAEIVLAGCAPIPLASYLKALGVFRLVAEQKDKTTRGCWRDETFVLDTTLTKEDLVRFFLDEYRPSPIISPWNGGSGFFPNDNKLGIRPIVEATAERFSAYKEAIEVAQSILKKTISSGSLKAHRRMQYERRCARDCRIARCVGTTLLSCLLRLNFSRLHCSVLGAMMAAPTSRTISCVG